MGKDHSPIVRKPASAKTLPAGASHDKHEVSAVVEPQVQASNPNNEDVVPANDTTNDDTNGTIHMQADKPLVESPPPEGEAKPEEPTLQPTGDGSGSKSLSPGGKSSSGPPTPLVKKIINSGTFGTGAVRTAPKASSTATTKTVTPNASPIKKSTTFPSAPSSKPAMAISKASSTGVSASPSGTTPSKRASLAPKAPAPQPTSKSTLSSSASTKPSSAAPASSGKASTVSPAGSTRSQPAARARASISDLVKLSPLKAKAVHTKSAGSPTATTRPSRATASISSIAEIRGDGGVLEDLQNKLKETSATLASKSETLVELQARVETLSSSLQTAISEAESQKLLVAQLEQAKANSEKDLKDTQAALEHLRSDPQQNGSALQEELATAKSNEISQTKLIETLQAQLQILEKEGQGAKEDLKSLRDANESAGAEAARDRDALAKTKEALVTAQVEAENWRSAHAQAQEEISLKVRDLESRAALAEASEAELAELKKEKADNASKLSELEVEILELKESQDAAEDERGRLLSKAKSLEDELAKAITATEQANERAVAKEKELANATDSLKAKHEVDLNALNSELAAVVARTEALREELVEGKAAVEEQTRKVEELEKIHLEEQNKWSGDMSKITAELEGQEEQYNAKIDAVKAEHDGLLQEAFERAKREAEAAHVEDLQAFQAESNATINQIRASHQSTIDALTAEHDLAVEQQVKALQKQIDDQGLVLKATQDDLAKAKAASDSARSEVENIQTQLNEARAALEDPAKSASPEHLAEVERLNTELSHAKDDISSLTELVNLTKASLNEMSNNRSTELEEAATRQAEEVTQLRTAHEEEVTALVAQKSELLVQLSDLQSELTILKASNAAEHSPKSTSNGTAHISSPGVTKEELQQMHEAHNLKLRDVQAEHDQAIKALKEELEAALSKASDYEQDVARKALEIQYLERDQEEQQDQMTRLQEDLDVIKEKLKATEPTVDE